MEAAVGVGYNSSHIPFTNTEELYALERTMNTTGKLDPQFKNYLFVAVLTWTEFADRVVRLYNEMGGYNCDDMVT